MHVPSIHYIQSNHISNQGYHKYKYQGGGGGVVQWSPLYHWYFKWLSKAFLYPPPLENIFEGAPEFNHLGRNLPPPCISGMRKEEVCNEKGGGRMSFRVGLVRGGRMLFKLNTRKYAERIKFKEIILTFTLN